MRITVARETFHRTAYPVEVVLRGQLLLLVAPLPFPELQPSISGGLFDQGNTCYTGNMKLPPYAKKYFWNVKVDELDTRRDAAFIAFQLLNRGDPRSVRWLLKHVPTRTIRETIMRRRGFSARTANFWRLFLGIPKTKVICLNPSYRRMRKSHWPY